VYYLKKHYLESQARASAGGTFGTPKNNFENIYTNPDKTEPMKGTTAALIFGMLIISIGLAWIITGGLSPAAAISPPAEPTHIQTIVPVTTILEPVVTLSPVPTPLPVPSITTSVSQTPLPTQPDRAFSANQVRDHFLDIAYASTNRLERLNYSESHSRVTVSLVSARIATRQSLPALQKSSTRYRRV